MLGLYVHVPFCSAICNYCNFNRGLFDGALKERYVEAVVAEISRVGADPRVGPGRTPFDSLALSLSKGELAQDRHGSAPTSPARDAADLSAVARSAKADTIYFGGGTPSLLEPHEIGRIIDACESAFAVAADREVTLEANPESVSEARLAGFREAGVNRVSFGVQSFRNEELRRLSRLHDAARAAAAVREARAAGFDNVGLDLMMWLPEQGVTEWIESVDQAIALAPEHMSLYLLELYPNAPIKEDMARARWSQAPDEVAAAMYLTAMDRLDEAGYDQYEVSNVARPDRRSRHNLKYWQDGDWIGIGCGAHSTRDGVRWKNVSATDEYIDRLTRGEPTATDVRRLSADERLGDALFTGLRLMDGIDLAAICDRYGVDVWERYGAELSPFLDEGCLKREGPRLKLTREGMLIAHEVMTIFV